MKFLCSLIFLLTTQIGWGQYQITTQAQLDGFGLSYVNNLTIGSDTCCSDINNLASLNNLQLVNGVLKIQNCPNLKNLFGLGNLKEMHNGGVLQIINCDSLVDLAGLSSYLDDEYGNGIPCNFSDNEQLQSLKYLPYGVLRRLTIMNCPKLEKLDINEFNGTIVNLYIKDCTSFLSLAGVNMYPEARIDMINTPKFTGFKGIQGVSKLSIEMDTCHAIRDFEGLEHLKETYIITANNCSQLNALTGLDSIKSRIYELNFTDCPNLSDFGGLPTDGVEIRKFTVTLDKKPDTLLILKNLDHAYIHDFKILGQGILGLEKMPNSLFVPNAILTDSFPKFSIYNKDLKFVKGSPTNGGEIYGVFALVANYKLDDISGLSAIKRFERYFGINYSKLSSLSALKNVKYFNKFLLGRNSLPLSISDIANADSIHSIGINDGNISSLAGLKKVKQLQSFSIYSDSTVTTSVLQELDSLQVSKGISIGRLTNIDTLNVFKTIKKLVGTTSSAGIYIDYMPNLKKISGFDNLEELGSKLTISANPNLTTIDGFKRLKKTGSFQLTQNDSLTDATGFCKLFKEGIITNIPKIQNLFINSAAQITASCDGVFVNTTSPDAVFDKMIAFPNPTNETLNIRLHNTENNNQIHELRIYNAFGQLAISHFFTGNETSIDLLNQQMGLYFVQILENGKIKAVGKVVILH